MAPFEEFDELALRFDALGESDTDTFDPANDVDAADSGDSISPSENLEMSESAMMNAISVVVVLLLDSRHQSCRFQS